MMPAWMRLVAQEITNLCILPPQGKMDARYELKRNNGELNMLCLAPAQVGRCELRLDRGILQSWHKDDALAQDLQVGRNLFDQNRQFSPVIFQCWIQYDGRKVKVFVQFTTFEQDPPAPEEKDGGKFTPAT